MRVRGTEADRWAHVQFGLIVTGETEQRCLADLFRILASQSNCSFKVIRRIAQRSPITSEKRIQKMVGTGKKIPDRDAEQIGFPAWDFLCSGGRFVILVDDLEASRAEKADAVFGRYREALDTVLGDSMSARAAVHFLANMLEAYYFGDARAVNEVLGTDLEDFDGDVETIKHPKNDLKSLCARFNEKEHGPMIVKRLDVQHVLAQRERCAFLRTMFKWASVAADATAWLPAGCLHSTTMGQIDALEEFLHSGAESKA
ncbi:MAG: hypothetical protein OXE48_10015 [Gammaproteobacteria bacterium]|nr:hypothetical protein [Gammaproteobacteria bacterium]